MTIEEIASNAEPTTWRHQLNRLARHAGACGVGDLVGAGGVGLELEKEGGG